MRRSDVNTDPERAQKRASSDLRCAARKLGPEATAAALFELFGQELIAALAQLGDDA